MPIAVSILKLFYGCKPLANLYIISITMRLTGDTHCQWYCLFLYSILY